MRPSRPRWRVEVREGDDWVPWRFVTFYSRWRARWHAWRVASLHRVSTRVVRDWPATVQKR
jgi:hypothetical protein